MSELRKRCRSWFCREFVSPRRLAFNFVFYGLHCSLFAYGWWSQVSDYPTQHLALLTKDQYTNQRLAGLNVLKYSVWVSRGAGLVLAFDAGLILIPVLRNIIRIIRPGLRFFLPVDENIWFHRQVAYSMAFWTTVHTTAHYVNFINIERRRMCFPHNLQLSLPLIL